MTRVKICGVTRGEDALLAARLGAAFIGLVLAESPRRAEPAAVLEWLPELRRCHPEVKVVGVFVRPTSESVARAAERLHLDLVQVHGIPAQAATSWPRPLILACGPDDLGAATRSGAWGVLVDTPGDGGGGGTGRSFDWSRVGAARPERLFLAGGLGPDNVADAIRTVSPWAVDASSRLEAAPGEKDPARLEAFFAAVRGAETPSAQGDHG